MGKLPYGPPNRHVQKSNGADTNIMKFYCTQNSTTYGSNWPKFQPRSARHVGTGYLANFRPGVYYSERLDQLDNPVMGKIVGSNYMTVTQRDFRPSVGSNGTDPLPCSVHQVGSGFVREKPITNPSSKEGPASMTTETATKFRGFPSERMDISRKTVGPNENTGFTHANDEPVTFQPGQPHKGDIPGYLTRRPTGRSIMKTDFQRYGYPLGNEPLPCIADPSEHNTGFTRGTNAEPIYVTRKPYDKADQIPGDRLSKMKKTDPAEYMNATNPNNHSSVAKNYFKGQQRPDGSEADRLARTSVGTKEPSGYCENNDIFVQTSDNPNRFITHYHTRFYDKTPFSTDREGHCRGDVQNQLPDGFTKSTYVHSYGPEVNPTGTLRKLESYVARSVKARDPFYDDHTHDKKVRFEVAAS
ncbi:stabilizer of axonemal microtubules 4-like isoform X2 [Lineus longissimus]|uniref:stabilizer of axonemal microtubules 4-like isoform X2 n=1 Tax=Lineus longissimus TaxID=88925 RepID=UPI00315CA034